MAIGDYDALFDSAGRTYNINPQLAKSLMMIESSGNPDVPDSSSGAQGPAQLMPALQKSYGVTDPRDPVQAVYALVRNLREGLDKTGTTQGALAYYHSGSTDPATWGPATQQSVQRVAAVYPTMVVRPGQPSQPGGSMPVPPIPPANPPPQAASAVAGTGPQDSDVVAGQRLFEQITGSPMRGAAPAPTEAPVTTPAAPVDPDVTAGQKLFQQITGSPMATAATPTAATPADPDGSQVPEWLQATGAGIARGIHDLTDAPAELLAKGAAGGATLINRGANALGIPSFVPVPDAQAVADADARDLATYNQLHGDSAIAGGARIGTQILGTLPALEIGGGLAGGAADIAGATAGQLLPRSAPLVEGATNFLAGKTEGGLLSRGASLAANGALQGAGGALVTSGQSDQPLADQIGTGAAGGAVLGPVARAAGTVIGKGVDAITGNNGGADPLLAKLAQIARDKYGIQVTAPQISENSTIKAMSDQSSKLPFSGAASKVADQQIGINRAVAGTMGETADRVTSEVMNQAAKRIGNQFDTIAQRTRIQSDPQLFHDIDHIEADARTTPLGANGEQSINNLLNMVKEAFYDPKTNSSQWLSGQAYQDLTKAGTPLSRAMKSGDPNVQELAGDIRSALDGAFQRSAAPSDQAALLQARQQWRAMKTIEPLVSYDGDISAPALKARVDAVSRRFDGSTSGNHYTGGGDLGEIADIGHAFMRAPANSNTADRGLINMLMLGGAGLGTYLQPGAMVAGATIPTIVVTAGRYARSAGLANRLIDSTLNPKVAPITGASNVVGAVAPTVGNAVSAGYNALTKPRQLPLR